MTVQPLALTNVSLVIGDADGTVLSAQTILIDRDGRISSVGPSAEVTPPPGCRVIDLTGRFALPGLINAHAHLFADGKPLPAVLTSEKAEKLVSIFMHSPFGRRMLAGRTKRNVLTQLNSGVTTIRSLGDVAYEVVDARNQIAATGGVTDARAIGEAGRPQMTEEEMTAICEEAHNAGILVAAHAQSKEDITAALRAGVDTIEHGAGMSQEMIDLFRENPRSLHGSSALIPTLQACLPLVELDRSITGIDDIVHANAEMILEEMLQGIRDATDNGITLGMGTDSALTYVTHYNTWREVDFVARHGGVGTARALHAATQANAKILGIDDETGAVAPGLSADILVVDADPIQSLRTLAAPRLVLARGHLIDNPTVTAFPEIDGHLDTLQGRPKWLTDRMRRRRGGRPGGRRVATRASGCWGSATACSPSRSRCSCSTSSSPAAATRMCSVSCWGSGRSSSRM